MIKDWRQQSAGRLRPKRTEQGDTLSVMQDQERQPQPQGLGISRGTWLAISGAGALILGAVSPWAEVLGGALSVKGTSGDGKLVLLIAGVAILAMALKRMWVPYLIAGLLAGAIAVYHIVDIQDSIGSDERAFGASVGWGLYVVLVGAALLLVSAYIRRSDSRRSKTTTPSFEPAHPDHQI